VTTTIPLYLVQVHNVTTTTNKQIDVLALSITFKLFYLWFKHSLTSQRQ